MIRTATIQITAHELLSAIWYSDGSAARFNVGIEGGYDGWAIDTIEESPDGESFLIHIYRDGVG